MKTTFKMNTLALSIGFMSVISSCEPKPKAETVDTNKTVIEPSADTSVKAPVDSNATSASTTEVKKDEKTK